MWTAADLAAMQATQEAHMMDTCYLWRWAGHDNIIDDYGRPSVAWINDEDTIPCGYQSKAREVLDGTQVTLTDAVIRLPIATVLDARDRIQVVTRHGASVTPQMFEVLGEARRGPSGLVLNVRLVTDGSDES